MKLSRCAVILTALASAALAQGPAHPSEQDLRARYMLPASKMITLDGTPIHYADEGRGPPIVLMHGSYASLLQWNDWARVLARSHRVIRFDMPPAGLSGPSPEARYDPVGQQAFLDAVTKALHVERFVLVATSSAGLAAANYAADHPERVRALVLNNIAISRPTMDRAAMPQTFRDAMEADKVLNGYHSEEYWRQVLLYNFVDKSKVTPALVRQWTELNNRYVGMPHPAQPTGAGFNFARTPGDLARIDAPTLLIWSADDHDTPLAVHADGAMKALKASDKSLVVIPNCGHMMPVECGDAGLKPTLAFLKRIGA